MRLNEKLTKWAAACAVNWRRCAGAWRLRQVRRPGDTTSLVVGLPLPEGVYISTC